MKIWFHAAATFLAGACFAAAAAEERILSFDADISVQVDGSMIVTETIRVKSEQQQIKRGIYRDFPTRYETTYGTVTVDFDILEVRRNGKREPHHTEDRSNGVRVYAGSSDRMLPPGKHEYTIRYYTDRQLGFFDGRDELYWNVTGNGWVFPIDHASARIRLPQGLNFFTESLEAYTGRAGDRGGDYRSAIDADGAAMFETTRALRAREGLTIVAAWPAGTIERPTASQRAGYFVRDHAAILFAACGATLVLFYYLLTWLRVGRDPEAGVVIPRYTPPEGLSPAGARYIRRMGYDHRAFASALINMAVKGHLVIDEHDGEYTLSANRDAGNPALSRGEQGVFGRLFRGGDAVVLKKKNHRTVRSAIQAHRQWLRNEYHKVYFKTNGWLLLPGVALSVVVLLIVGFSFLPRSTEFIFMSVWLAGWTFTLFMLIRQGQKLMAGIFGLFEIGAVAAFIGLGSYTFIALVIALIAFNALFFYLIKAPTDAGRRIMDEIDGLKMYMEVAEKERMDLLNPPEQTPRHYETLLPYALALGVDQQWSERFAARLAKQSSADTDYRPGWYRGERGFSSSGFGSSLGASLSSAVSASATAPGSSSGGGGGGSSGGGGGGGGGGGW